MRTILFLAVIFLSSQSYAQVEDIAGNYEYFMRFDGKHMADSFRYELSITADSFFLNTVQILPGDDNQHHGNPAFQRVHEKIIKTEKGKWQWFGKRLPGNESRYGFMRTGPSKKYFYATRVAERLTIYFLSRKPCRRKKNNEAIYTLGFEIRYELNGVKVMDNY